MNYCKKCGAPLAPGAKFCTKCGTPVTEEKAQEDIQQNSQIQNPQQSQPQQDQWQSSQQSQPQQNQWQGSQQSQTQQNQWQGSQQSQQQASQQGQSQQSQWQNQQVYQQQYVQAHQRKPINKGLIIGLAAAAAAVVVLIFGINYHRHSYDLTEYVKVDYTGFEKYGTVEPEVDTDKLENKLAGLYGLSNKDLEDYDSLSELGGDYKKALKIDDFVDSVETEVESDSQGSLSNGDTVEVKIKYSKAAAKKLGLHISGDSMTAKVEGLGEGKVINPFDSVSISFSGALPYLTPEIKVDENSKFNVSDFSISTGEGKKSDGGNTYLSKAGQEFTVTYNGENDPEDGVLYAPTKKKYKAGKVDSYVREPSELSEKNRKQLVGHAKKYLWSDFGSDYDLKFEGCITELANSYDDASYGRAQYTYVIFSYDYDDWDDYDDTRYVYVAFPDVEKQSDGTLWYDSGENSSNLSRSYDSFYSMMDVYSSIITDGYDVKTDPSLGI